jgi:porin
VPASNRFLLGDGFSVRPWMDDLGVSIYVSSTQFEQGVAAGGSRQAFTWGAKFDMLAHLDSAKLGLWDGGTLDLFAESRLGQSVDTYAGTYSPPNLSMFFPVPNGSITAITGLKYTQSITERSGLFFGKLNALNGDPERFLKYPLTSRFWNAAFNFNLALDRYPYSTPGAGFYASLDPGPDVAFLVLNSYNAPRTSGLENLGRNGVFLYAQARQATEFFGLPGRQVFAGLFGTGSFTDLSPASFIELPSGATVAPLKTGTWTLLWNIEQRLWVDADDPQRGLGLYVQTGLGDGNPNPVRWFVSASFCGNSPLPGHEGDTFGVGFYDLGISTKAKDLVPGLRDEYGVELFYNLRIAPGCHLTPDLQVVRPGLAPVGTALLLGARLKIDF